MLKAKQPTFPLTSSFFYHSDIPCLHANLASREEHLLDVCFFQKNKQEDRRFEMRHRNTRGGIGAGGRADEAFVARARKIFDSYDAKGLGHLDRHHVKLAWLELLGFKPSRCELADLMGPGEDGQQCTSEADKDEDAAQCRVGWAQFVQAAARRRAGTDGSDEIRLAFKAFDRRCAGFLTLSDVKIV